MFKKTLTFALLSLLMLFSFFEATSATNNISGGRVVLLILNGTDLADIDKADMPYIKRLIEEKKLSVGLMNARSAKAAVTETSGFLTIGTGAKANAGLLGSQAFGADEKFVYQQKEYVAGAFYKQATGIDLKKDEVANMSIADASRLSDEYDYPLVPGLLGSLLKEAGVKRAVLGNADAIDGYHREATLIAMDTKGKVDFGNVSERLSDKQLLEQRLKFSKKARFVVIDYGKTGRLEFSRIFLTDKQYQKQKIKALKNADRFIGNLTKDMDLSRDLLIVVSPTPSVLAQKQKNLLSPILVSNTNNSNLLYSPSTRWPGIVDNLDIAPTVLDFFNINQPAEMAGNPLDGKTVDGEPIGRLLKEEGVAVANNQARLPLLTGFVTLIIINIILATILLFLTNVSKRAYGFIQALLVFTVCPPLVFLLFGLISYTNPLVPIFGVTAASVVLAVILKLVFKNNLRAILFLCLATLGVIVIDSLSGSHLMRSSVLGYSPIIGARFYGIGNEYEGVIIGVTIMSLFVASDLFGIKKGTTIAISSVLFVAVVFILGFPAIGADVGGAISAIIGFSFAYFYLTGGRLRWQQLLVLLGLLVVALGAIFAADILLGTKSHASKASNLVSQGGVGEIVTIFKRKILANLKLVKYTAWTKVLLTILIAAPVLFIKPAGAVKRLKEKFPNIWAGAVGVSFGSIAAFLFNDSGVVAAATCLLYAAVVVLYAIIEDQKNALVR